MVGGTGIEPVTPAMSRQELKRNHLILLHMAAPLICVCATNMPLTFSRAGSMNQRALCYRVEFLLCARCSTNKGLHELTACEAVLISARATKKLICPEDAHAS
jgi:hypothetical protein